MHSFTYSLFAAATAISHVYAAAADPLALATVKAQFVGAKIVPDAIPTFSPSAVFNVKYASPIGDISVGQAIAKDSVADVPTLSATGFTNGTFTALIVDADYVGAPVNDAGLNMHWLQNDLAIAADGTLSTQSPARVPYAGPGPADGSGPHRYTVLLYSQPASFAAPAAPAANAGVARLHLADYVKSAGFSDPVGGTYFTVEVGTSTVSVDATVAVNTATLSVAGSSSAASASATGSGSKSAASVTGTGSGSASSPSATTTQGSGAARNGVVGVVAWVSVAVAGWAVLA